VTDDEQTQAEERESEGKDRGAKGEDGGGADKASSAAEQAEEAKQKVKDLEDAPTEKLEDWPDDKAKYETFGGPEGEESYDDSVTRKLGPSSLRYREDGSVEIEGDEVDDPDEYKSDPIPGGPTDPRISDARAYGEPDLTDETSIDAENGPGDEGDGRSGEGEGEDEGESDKEGAGRSEEGEGKPG